MMRVGPQRWVWAEAAQLGVAGLPPLPPALAAAAPEGAPAPPPPLATATNAPHNTDAIAVAAHCRSGGRVACAAAATADAGRLRRACV